MPEECPGTDEPAMAAHETQSASPGEVDKILERAQQAAAVLGLSQATREMVGDAFNF
ncbi:hypothetical protein IPG41_06175 [Candidatus Peregrinibacteria bacterium]|nr:MAG: hypothetical protein IPG41_06175 [Candidatus Peregrinibacteria bacterium]